MFALRRIVSLVAMPIGFTLLLGAVALLLLFLGRRKTSKRWRWAPRIVAACAFLFLYVASIPLTGDLLLRSLESEFQPVDPESAPTADVIVVLGGGAPPPHAPGLIGGVTETGPRFDMGMRLLSAHRAPFMILSGGSPPMTSGAGEGERLRPVAISRGAAPESVIVTPAVRITSEEAEAVAEIARERGFHSILLVTSARHLNRAAALFRGRGLTVTPIASDWSVSWPRQWSILDLAPTAESLYRTQAALHEYLGRLAGS